MTSISQDAVQSRINIEEPRYNQNTYAGRAKHFFITTNPLNLLATNSELKEAKDLVERYRQGITSVPSDISEDQLWKAKQLYDSAYHPDTKEKMILPGRMSAQVPMNMTITGCMMTFFRTTPAVIFWQWINQTFNAVVNYTNRSGEHPIPIRQLGISYALATGGAMVTALGLNSIAHTFPPLIARYVPFAAVAAANCINIPCMRSRELKEGISVFDEDGNHLGSSVVAAKSAISQVVVSRIIMAMPGMILPPIVMHKLEDGPFFKKLPWARAPLQVGLVGVLLIFATPLCCALFPQKSSLAVHKLEEDLQKTIQGLAKPPTRVYFNKGL